MNSALALLTSVNQSKPCFGFSKLSYGNYEIVLFRLVKNKQYKATDEKPKLKRVLLVELKDQVLFLPEYFAIKFQGEDGESLVEQVNTNGIKKFLYFGGKRSGSNAWDIKIKTEEQINHEMRQVTMAIESQNKIPDELFDRFYD